MARGVFLEQTGEERLARLRLPLQIDDIATFGAQGKAMDLEIVAAGDAEYETVINLARFYIYDMAEHAGFPFGENGDFVVGDQFNPWWGRERPWGPDESG